MFRAHWIFFAFQSEDQSKLAKCSYVSKTEPNSLLIIALLRLYVLRKRRFVVLIKYIVIFPPKYLFKKTRIHLKKKHALL